MAILKPRASCCKCHTRNNISPYMINFWICRRCSVAETIILLEGFLKKDVFTHPERLHIEQSLKRLRKELKELEATGSYPKRWIDELKKLDCVQREEKP